MPWVSEGLYSVMVSEGEPMSSNTADARLFSVMVSDGEPMSSNTPDSLDLSKAILSNGN